MGHGAGICPCHHVVEVSSAAVEQMCATREWPLHLDLSRQIRTYATRRLFIVVHHARHATMAGLGYAEDEELNELNAQVGSRVVARNGWGGGCVFFFPCLVVDRVRTCCCCVGCILSLSARLC